MKNLDVHKGNDEVRGLEVKKNREGFSLSLSNKVAVNAILALMFAAVLLIMTPGGLELLQKIIERFRR